MSTIDRLFSPSSFTSLAVPKSRSFTLPLLSTIRFDGLISLWMKPALWTSSRSLITGRSISSSLLKSFSGPFSFRRCCIVSPSMNSMTIYAVEFA